MTKEEYNRVFVQDGEKSTIKYFDDVISKVLEEHFKMKHLEKGHICYGEWKEHRRQVVSLYAAKGTFYSIEWGYDYDFIHSYNRQKKADKQRNSVSKLFIAKYPKSMYDYVQ